MPDPSRSYDYREFLIDEIMPAREVHLIIGPAGVGKTTLTLQWISDFQDGLPVLGRRVWPTGVVFISCDRSQAAHLRRLDSLGIPHDKFPYFSPRDQGDTNIEYVVRACASNYPRHKVLFIDGLATLLPDGKPSDYNGVASFLKKCGRLCVQHDRTIIGTLHATKTKEGEGYQNPRQRTLGSTAWAGYADLMIIMDLESASDVSNNVRVVNVLTRAGAGDFTVKYRLDKENGNRYVPYEDPIESDLLTLLDSWLPSLPFDQLMPKKLFVDYGREQSLSERSVERWLTAQLESGTIERPQKGKYRRIHVA